MYAHFSTGLAILWCTIACLHCVTIDNENVGLNKNIAAVRLCTKMYQYSKQELIRLKLHAVPPVNLLYDVSPTSPDFRPNDLIFDPEIRKRGSRGGSRRHLYMPSLRHLYGTSQSVNELSQDLDLSPITRNMKIALVNTQSVRNKGDDYMEYVTRSNLDLIMMTETWLHPHGDEHTKSELKQAGYDFHDIPRVNRDGGGIALHWSSALNVKSLNNGEFSSFQYGEWKVMHGQKSVVVTLIYHSPYSLKNPVTDAAFVEEFSDYLDEFMDTYGHCEILIAGDFNLHVDDEHNSVANTFLDLLDSRNLTNHVNVQTHDAGHTLDLLITKCETELELTPPTAKYYISDHCFVESNLQFPLAEPCVETVTFRKWKSINETEFMNELDKSELCKKSNWDNLSELESAYRETLTDITNRLAPEVTKKLQVKPRKPWFTSEIKKLRTERRRLERKWQKTKNENDHLEFKKLRQELRKQVYLAKKQHYSALIENCAGNVKDLYVLTNNLTGVKKSNPLPSDVTGVERCNNFAEYFVGKINQIKTDIKQKMESENEERISGHTSRKPNVIWSDFKSKSEDEIKRHVLGMPSKHCASDPVPTWLIKNCIDKLNGPITRIINLSLQNNCFLSVWKEALITPLIKKPSEGTQYSNYRPVSNLAFISKVVESVVTKELTDYLENNNLLPSNFSAYRKLHSTETALLKVMADALCKADSQYITMLLMLDMSAAFDTVDCDILSDILENRMGISGNVKQWLLNYMRDRKFRVKAGGSVSDLFNLPCGVPQGSTLGPVLFSIYMSSLFDQLDTYPIEKLGYADDTQLYCHSKTSAMDINNTISSMELSVHEARTWIMTHELKINDSKTELMLMGTRQQLCKNKEIMVKIGDSVIKPVDKVKNLGVILDSNMTMEKQINQMTSRGYYALYRIKSIRPYLTESATKILVQSLIFSHLDYGNSLLYGAADVHLIKLQRLQNSAVRLVKKLGRFDRITPYMKELHWLPVPYRIRFKICLITFKALNFGKPDYVRNMIEWYEPTRELKSSNSKQLKVPMLKSETARKSYYYSAPLLWNELPFHLRSTTDLEYFKKHLKTHFFLQAYKQ